MGNFCSRKNTHSKVESIEEEYNTLGNNKFQAKRFQEAIEEYTKAIRHVERLIEKNKDTEVIYKACLSKYYSNRSNCFISLKNYENALKDSESCININPDWYKGYHRKFKALKCLDKSDDAYEVLLLAKDRLFKIIKNNKIESYSQNKTDKTDKADIEYKEICMIINNTNKESIKVLNEAFSKDMLINKNNKNEKELESFDKMIKEATKYYNTGKYYKAYEVLLTIIAIFKLKYGKPLKNPNLDYGVLKIVISKLEQITYTIEMYDESISIINTYWPSLEQYCLDNETDLKEFVFYKLILINKKLNKFEDALIDAKKLKQQIDSIKENKSNKENLLKQINTEIQDIQALIKKRTKEECNDNILIQRIKKDYIENYVQFLVKFNIFDKKTIDEFIKEDNYINQIIEPFHYEFKKFMIILNKIFDQPNSSINNPEKESDDADFQSFIEATSEYNKFTNNIFFRGIAKIYQGFKAILLRKSIKKEENKREEIILSEISCKDNEVFKLSNLKNSQLVLYQFLRLVYLNLSMQLKFKPKSIMFENSSKITIDDSYLIERYGILTFNKFKDLCLNNSLAPKEPFIPFKERCEEIYLPLFNEYLYDFNISSILSQKEKNFVNEAFNVLLIDNPDLFALISMDFRKIKLVNFITSDIISLTKNLIILSMIINNAEVSSIIEVWFSTFWKKSTRTDFENACNKIISEKFLDEYVDFELGKRTDLSMLGIHSNQEVLKKSVIKEVELMKNLNLRNSEMLEKWHNALNISNTLTFKREIDRLQYAFYLYTGAVNFNLTELYNLANSFEDEKSNNNKYSPNVVFYRYHEIFNKSDFKKFSFANFYSTINPFLTILDKRFESEDEANFDYINYKNLSSTLEQLYINRFLKQVIEQMKSFILHKYVDIKFYFGGNTKTKLTDNLMISKLLNSSDIVYWGDHFDHLSKEKINKLNLNKEIFEKEFNLSTQYHLCFSSEWGKETNGTVIYDFQPQKREMLINDVSRFFMDIKSKMNQDNIVYSSIDSNKIVNLSLHSAHKTSFGASFNLKAKYLNDYIFNKFKENNKISKIDILNTLYNPFSTIPNQISYIFNID